MKDFLSLFSLLIPFVSSLESSNIELEAFKCKWAHSTDADSGFLGFGTTYQSSTEWYKVPGWEECGGSRQSPIDLPQWTGADSIVWTSSKATADHPTFNYSPIAMQMVLLRNKGNRELLLETSNSLCNGSSSHQRRHLGSTSSSTLSFGNLSVHGRTFDAKSISFHMPSEHTVNGQKFAAELQIIHRLRGASSSTSEHVPLAIVSIFIESANGSTDWNFLNNHFGFDNSIPSEDEIYCAEEGTSSLDLSATFSGPLSGGFYHYGGSLTTPPCTQNVNWFIMKETIPSMSSLQAKYFKGILGNEGNARPLASVCRRQKIDKISSRNRYLASIDYDSNSNCSIDIPGIHVGYVTDTSLVEAIAHDDTWHRLHSHAYVAIYFPFVALCVGCLAYETIEHQKINFPYTAVVLVLGIFIGFIESKVIRTPCDLGTFSQSLDMWANIDGHLLLYAFLPVLLFGDAMNLNMHQFFKTLPQSITLASVGVLVGSLLTALVAYTVLPDAKSDGTEGFGWDWNLCMAFGAICAATDPVAVVSLLKAVGASPVLTMQITGESLFNDGTAIVLFLLFFDIYTGKQESFELGYAVSFFVKMSVAGPLLGIFFGFIGHYWIRRNSRMGEHADVTIQMALTFCCAYLSFYFGESEFHVSGVLTVVCAALVLAQKTHPVLIDHKALHHVWHAVEYIGNTLIFMLAGLICYRTVDPLFSTENERVETSLIFYAILMFIFMISIRAFMLILLYPFLSKCGYGVSIKDIVFMTWGGLRGAVGIALAVYVKEEMKVSCASIQSIEKELKDKHCQRHGSQLLFLVCSMAFLTLVINAPTSKMLLEKMGLLNPSKAQERIISDIRQRLVEHTERVFQKLNQRQHAHAWNKETFQSVRAFLEKEIGEDFGEDILSPRNKARREAMLRDVRKIGAIKEGKQEEVMRLHFSENESFYQKTKRESVLSQIFDVEDHDIEDGVVTIQDDDDNGHDRKKQNVKKNSKSSTATIDEISLEVHVGDMIADIKKDELKGKHDLVASPSMFSKRSRSGSSVTSDGSSHHRASMAILKRERNRTTSSSNSLSSSPRSHPPKFNRSKEVNKTLINENRMSFLRIMFLHCVQTAYWEQIENAILPAKSSVVSLLLESIEVAKDNAEKPLSDWKFCQLNMPRITDLWERTKSLLCRGKICTLDEEVIRMADFSVRRKQFHMANCFIEAHREARHTITVFFDNTTDDDSPEEQKILEESYEEEELAAKIIDDMPDSLEKEIRHKTLALTVLRSQRKFLVALRKRGIISKDALHPFFSILARREHVISRRRHLVGSIAAQRFEDERKITLQGKGRTEHMSAISSPVAKREFELRKMVLGNSK
eukprot:g5089.t1